MAEALLVGAAVGALFGEVLKLLIENKSKAKMFKSSFSLLESTIQRATPYVLELQSLNRKLDRSEEELRVLKEIMEKAKSLIHKCLKVHPFNIINKIRYAEKIEDINKSIKNFIEVDLQLQQSRDGKETLDSVRSLVGNGNGSRSEPMGMCSPPENQNLKSVGLDVPLKELKGKLFRDGTCVIVVSAPAECGKTTLAKELCGDYEIKGKFKSNILFVTVSKTPNLQCIVQKLLMHKGHKVPEFVNDEDAINQLGQLMKQLCNESPILLVLDDVWCFSQSLVEKFVFQLSDYKILVMSRYYFPCFGSPYRLKPLSYDDAFALFSQSAFKQASVPDKVLVRKILKICKGFPLAIKVVASLLSGQPQATWKSQLMRWSKGASIIHSSTDLRDCLYSSIVALGAIDLTLQECYMDLGSFPEDERISASSLVDMWVEFYGLDEDGIEAMANLHMLSSRNLLDSSSFGKDENDVDGFYNGHFVTQHDLLRELVIHQSNVEPALERKRLIVEITGNTFPSWWSQSKQLFNAWWLQPKQLFNDWWLQSKHLFNARFLSITTDESFSSEWNDMQCPEVEVIVLNIRSKKYALPNFMKKMDKVKVLVVKNYGFHHTEVDNFSVLESLSSLKRMRFERLTIPSLNLNTVQFQNLQKLSLVLCNIGNTFKNQISNAFPNLVEIDIDYCNGMEELPEAICKMRNLKKLSVTNCNNLCALPEAIGTLLNLEYLRLGSCIHLFALPDTIRCLTNLSYLDISDCLSITQLPSGFGELRSLRKICMRGCSSCELPDSVVDLQDLEVICDEETAIKWRCFQSSLKNRVVKVTEEDTNLNWLHT